VFGKLGRIVPIQLPNGEDLLSSLKKVCAENGIRYGSILTTLGTLRKVTFVNLIRSEKTKTGFDFGEPRVIPGPLQVLSLQGLILEAAGEMAIHSHGAFVGMDGKVYGGHLVEGENPIEARLETIICEISNVRLMETYDEKTGQYGFSVEPLGEYDL
jgi:hypothetical protein